MVCYLSRRHNPRNSTRLILGMQRMCVCVCVTCARPCVCVCVCALACVCACVSAYRCYFFHKAGCELTLHQPPQSYCAPCLVHVVTGSLCFPAVPIAVHHPCCSDNPSAAMYPRTIVVWPSCMLHNFTHCLGVQEMREHAADLQQAEAMPEHTCSFNLSGEFCVQTVGPLTSVALLFDQSKSSTSTHLKLSNKSGRAREQLVFDWSSTGFDTCCSRQASIALLRQVVLGDSCKAVTK